MATVISLVLLFLVSWLLTWALLMAAYLGLSAVADRLKARWRRYERVRQHRRAVAAELARIDRETSASVRRIGAVFMVAQRLIRDHADAERRGGGP
jgi:biopolymer transport protein ExbB/TolQ